MPSPIDRVNIDAQQKCSRLIAEYIISALATARGPHAETCVTAAARMGGTILFRTFGLPTANMQVGSTVLSDIANQCGPVLVEVMRAGLSGLGIEIDDRIAGSGPTEQHAPLLTIIQTQEKLDARIGELTTSLGLHGEPAARSCALATALLISLTKDVLDPNIAFGLAVYGFVEGTKTIPIASMVPPAPAPSAKSWFKF